MSTKCTLSDRHARKVVAQAWRHLRKHFPDDARILSVIVRRIVPLSDEEEGAGYVGFWIRKLFKTKAQQQAFEKRFKHGQGFGFIKLVDNRDLTLASVAHELGHAFTSRADVLARCSPVSEWAHESVADLHAVRWGLLTFKDIEKRHGHEQAGRSYSRIGFGSEGRWHHGPHPSDTPFEYEGRKWVLSKDFVFSPYVPPVRKVRKQKPWNF